METRSDDDRLTALEASAARRNERLVSIEAKLDAVCRLLAEIDRRLNRQDEGERAAS